MADDKNDKNLELANFVLNNCTCALGTDLLKIDFATFFIDSMKQELGMFEREIEEFVELLGSLEIIDEVRYIDAASINPEMTGKAYECEMNILRMKEFIKNSEVIFPNNPDGRPRRKKFASDLESEFTGFSTILDTVFNTQGTRELRAIFAEKEYFDFPKPKDLLKKLFQMF